MCARRERRNEIRRPTIPTVGAAGHINIIVKAPRYPRIANVVPSPLDDARFTRVMDVVDIVGEWIGDDGPMDTVVGRIGCGPGLADERTSDIFPGKAVVI